MLALVQMELVQIRLQRPALLSRQLELEQLLLLFIQLVILFLSLYYFKREAKNLRTVPG